MWGRPWETEPRDNAKRTVTYKIAYLPLETQKQGPSLISWVVQETGRNVLSALWSKPDKKSQLEKLFYFIVNLH